MNLFVLQRMIIIVSICTLNFLIRHILGTGSIILAGASITN